MRLRTQIVTALLTVSTLPAVAYAATIGGYYYATQYDWREFYSVADGKPFRVVLAGNPFPALAPDDVARQLLPQLQANKPRVRLTFTYDRPLEEPRPNYRLVLIFDPANDLNAYSVCGNGEMRARPSTPGRVYVFGIYCRNEIAMSQTTGWTVASGPSDPRVGELFKDLLAVVFSDQPALYNRSGRPRMN